MEDEVKPAGNEKLDNGQTTTEAKGTAVQPVSPVSPAIVSPKQMEISEYQKKIEELQGKINDTNKLIQVYEKNAKEANEVIATQRSMLLNQAEAVANPMSEVKENCHNIYWSSCADILKGFGIKPENIEATMRLVEAAEPDWDEWIKSRRFF